MDLIRPDFPRKTFASVRWWLTERAVRWLERAGYTVHPGHCADQIDWPPLPAWTPPRQPRLFQLLQGISDPSDGAA